jgi:hypothetical protein
MQQITEWKGHRKLKTALFLDRKNGTSHEFLNEAESEKMKIPPAESVTSLHIPEKPAVVPAPNPSIAGSITVPNEQNSADEVEDVTDDAAANPANSCITDDTFGESSPEESYDDWIPAAEDWFTATISKVGPGYLFALLTNSEQVFIPIDTVRNLPNQHQCLTQVGDTLRLHMGVNPQGSPRWLAKETVLDAEYSVEGEESGVVVWWKDDQHVGMVERHPCRCRAFVSNQMSCDYFSKGEDVVISEWEPSRHPEHLGLVATAIRRWKNINPSPSDDSGIIRL